MLGGWHQWPVWRAPPAGWAIALAEWGALQPVVNAAVAGWGPPLVG